MSCGSGKEKKAGLCYTPCRKGFKGVGPVCWGQPPKGWVNCGMGAAKDSKTCGQVIFDQVTSVGEMGLNLATFGTSSAATTGASASKDLSKMRKLYKDLKKAYEKTEDMRELADKAMTVKDYVDTA